MPLFLPMYPYWSKCEIGILRTCVVDSTKIFRKMSSKVSDDVLYLFIKFPLNSL